MTHGDRRTGQVAERPLMMVQELRIQIEHYAAVADDSSFARDVIGMCLVRLARDHGVIAANRAIEDFDLEVKGWAKRPVPEEAS